MHHLLLINMKTFHNFIWSDDVNIIALFCVFKIIVDNIYMHYEVYSVCNHMMNLHLLSHNLENVNRTT